MPNFNSFVVVFHDLTLPCAPERDPLTSSLNWNVPIPVITGGNIKLNPRGVGKSERAFVIPKALFDSVKTQAGQGASKEILVEMILKVGYTPLQANFVYEKAVE